MNPRLCCRVLLLLAAASAAWAQEPGTSTKTAGAAPADDPLANPARPTVSTPATLTPPGYLQFETGFLAAWHSPGVSQQNSLNEVIKFSVSRWLELLAVSQPFGHTRSEGEGSNAAGDVDLGLQAVVHHGEGAKPTIAFSYVGRVYAGTVPDLDIGSYRNSAFLLLSADVWGFHYDTNYLFNEVVDGAVRRSQFGQTLSVSHPLAGKFGLSGELWHFTQPFQRSNAVGNLWALNYNATNQLVIDGGFQRGLTTTSARWEVFAGFTYLLPHKISLR